MMRTPTQVSKAPEEGTMQYDEDVDWERRGMGPGLRPQSNLKPLECESLTAM